jgi:hypothetical protein
MITRRSSQLLERMDFLGREYVNFIESFEDISLKEIPFTEDFKTFRKNHPINFGNASLVDLYFFGHCGSYWISAYIDYLNDNETYSNSKYVGILTFDM